MTPTFIDDIAFAFRGLVEKNARGIYHVVGSDSLSPYSACLKIAQTFGYNEALVKQTTRAEFFKDRAPRPERLALDNTKLRSLGVTMRGFDEGLQEMKRQMEK
jgi:dTDP-4-dehydrorhamnose reductase